MRFITLFIKNNIIQLKRQWLSLSLLLLFPIILIGLSIFLIATYLLPSEENVIEIGLVDLDKSKETELINEMITKETDANERNQIINMNDESEESNKNDNYELIVYILYPDEFITKLYEGISVEVEIVGNPQRTIESEMTKELIDSLMRHINTSQANILLLNERAKELNMPQDERQAYLFNQFTSFLLYTTGKDKALNKEEMTQHQNTSPINYYAVVIWFIVSIIWLFIIYNFLYRGMPTRIETRIKLYGVTKLQQIIARISVTLVTTLMLVSITFVALTSQLGLDFELEDYLRMFNLFSIMSVIYLLILALLELIFTSEYIRLFIQLITTFIMIGLSGALIPSIYFPVAVQEILTYLPFNHTFYWLKEVIFEERFYVEYKLLLIIVSALFIVFACLAIWKERTH